MIYDLLVVGGGIHGVGVAQAAAAAGHKVVLVEQQALASGTSRRSSKLIHGGLRYLESAQFSLVRECLRERELLLKNAPQLVQLKPFFIPVYQQTRRRPWQLWAGLSLYAALNGWHASSRFQRLARQHWSQLDGLRTDHLQQVFQYFDAQTDDAQLTRAVMHSARQLGAELKLPATLLSARYQQRAWQVQLRTPQGEENIEAGIVVNAAGPWATSLAEQFSPALPQVPVELVQGTHLLVPGEISRGIYYVEAPQDGRAVFVMPWHGQTLIGTTEKLFHGEPQNVQASEEEIEYLLQVLRHYFPQRQITDYESFAGLRVLPSQQGDAFHRSRDTLVLVDDVQQPRAAVIYGGKLTAYRATAQQVMQKLQTALPSKTPLADTKTLSLTPAPQSD